MSGASIIPSILSTTHTLTSRRGSSYSSYSSDYDYSDELESYKSKIWHAVVEGELSYTEGQKAIKDKKMALEDKKMALIAARNRRDKCDLIVIWAIGLVSISALLTWGIQDRKKQAAASQEMKDAFQKEPAVTVVNVNPVYDRLGLDATGDGIADYCGHGTTSELGVTKSGAEWMQLLTGVHKAQSMQ